MLPPTPSKPSPQSQVCVKPAFDENMLMSYGYNIEAGTPMFSYYYGFNTYTNYSMVGWGGLSDAGDFLDPSGNLTAY